MKTKLLMALTMTAALTITSIISGCATAPIASDSAQAEGQSFNPPPGMCNIYLIRREAYMGGAILVQTSVDGMMTGALQTGTYILKTVPAGFHTVSVFSNENQDAKNITAQAGQNYFFDVKSQWGWVTARFNLNEISDVDARAAVLRCKRAAGM